MFVWCWLRARCGVVEGLRKESLLLIAVGMSRVSLSSSDLLLRIGGMRGGHGAASLVSIVACGLFVFYLCDSCSLPWCPRGYIVLTSLFLMQVADVPVPDTSPLAFTSNLMVCLSEHGQIVVHLRAKFPVTFVLSVPRAQKARVGC